MRGKGLFTKVVAIFAAVAMLASMSVCVFAAFGDDAIGYYESGIKITAVGVVDGDVTGDYKVTVDYALDEGVSNKNGISMLAYAGESLSATSAGYTDFDEATMTIVGIGQQKQDASLVGSFEFVVDDTQVTPGVAFIVKVSGDDATVKPAAAEVKIGSSPVGPTKVEAASATISYSGSVIDVTTEGDASEEVKAYLEANMANQTAILFDSESTKVGTTTATKDDITDVNVAVGGAPNTYLVEVTIPDTATVISETGYETSIPEGGLITTFIVTAKTASAVLLGDVNQDGFVDDMDWTVIFNHVSYIIEDPGLPSWADETYDPAVFEAADVNMDGFVDDMDWTVIFNHVSYIIEDPNLPAW